MYFPAMVLYHFWLLSMFIISTFSSALPFYGIDYGINIYSCPSLDHVRNDFAALRNYTNRIRIFGLALCNQGALALQASQELGMRLYLGMWMDGNEQSFQQELAELTTLMDRFSMDNVDGIIVGSEVLYRKDASLQFLLQSIDHVREITAHRGIPITNADTFDRITPELADHLDFVMINIFPYWEGVPIEKAADTLIDHYYEVVNRIGNSKRVRISETGWPSSGPDFRDAVASLENQSRYLRQVLCRTRSQGIDMFWFSAMDEPYKQGVEAHFGLFKFGHGPLVRYETLSDDVCSNSQ